MMPHYMNYQSGMPVWYGPLITEIVWCCKISCIRTMIALQRNLAIGLIISKKCGRRAELPNAAMRWNIVQSVQGKFLRKELGTIWKICFSDFMLVKPKCVWQDEVHAKHSNFWFTSRYKKIWLQLTCTFWLRIMNSFRGTAIPFSVFDLLHTVYYFKREEKPFYSLPTCPKGREVS